MEPLKPKIAIIGASHVGSTFAFSLMLSGLVREIVLIDQNESFAIGECMDLNHGLSFAHPIRIYAAGRRKNRLYSNIRQHVEGLYT